MIPALSIDEICERVKDRYDYDESRIVGIMLARYNTRLSKQIINDCYSYWHYYADRDFDLFWLGYGEYSAGDQKNIIVLKFPENRTRHFFDTKEFVKSIKAIKEYTNSKWSYKDTAQLMLVNYHHGNLHFDERIVINLEENLDVYLSDIRQLVSEIIDDTAKYSDIRELHNAMLKDEFRAKIKKTSISVAKEALGPLSPLIE